MGDGLLILGLEVGMVLIDEVFVVEKGVFGSGQMIVVDMVEGKFYYDIEIKDFLVQVCFYGDWVGKICDLDVEFQVVIEIFLFFGNDLCCCQVVVGYFIEELEQIFVLMVEDGKEIFVFMGDDIFLVVLFKQYCLLSYFFCQNFSQVMNFLIDSLCEFCVMLLKMWFGNFKNVFDEDGS